MEPISKKSSSLFPLCLTERAVRKQHSGRSRAYWRRSWTVSREVNCVVCMLCMCVCANINRGMREVCDGDRERKRERVGASLN